MNMVPGGSGCAAHIAEQYSRTSFRQIQPFIGRLRHRNGGHRRGHGRDEILKTLDVSSEARRETLAALSDQYLHRSHINRCLHQTKPHGGTAKHERYKHNRPHAPPEHLQKAC